MNLRLIQKCKRVRRKIQSTDEAIDILYLCIQLYMNPDIYSELDVHNITNWGREKYKDREIIFRRVYRLEKFIRGMVEFEGNNPIIEKKSDEYIKCMLENIFLNEARICHLIRKLIIEKFRNKWIKIRNLVKNPGWIIF